MPAQRGSRDRPDWIKLDSHLHVRVIIQNSEGQAFAPLNVPFPPLSSDKGLIHLIKDLSVWAWSESCVSGWTRDLKSKIRTKGLYIFSCSFHWFIPNCCNYISYLLDTACIFSVPVNATLYFCFVCSSISIDRFFCSQTLLGAGTSRGQYRFLRRSQDQPCRFHSL